MCCMYHSTGFSHHPSKMGFLLPIAQMRPLRPRDQASSSSRVTGRGDPAVRLWFRLSPGTSTVLTMSSKRNELQPPGKSPLSSANHRAPPTGPIKCRGCKAQANRPELLNTLGLKISQSERGAVSGLSVGLVRPKTWAKPAAMGRGHRGAWAPSGRETRGLCVAIWAERQSLGMRTSLSLFPN